MLWIRKVHLKKKAAYSQQEKRQGIFYGDEDEFEIR